MEDYIKHQLARMTDLDDEQKVYAMNSIYAGIEEQGVAKDVICKAINTVIKKNIQKLFDKI